MNENGFLISMFIDDELSLDEKTDFVEEVHRSRDFRDEAISLLAQEKDLRSGGGDARPLVIPKPVHARRFPMGMGMAAAATAVAAIVLFSLFLWQPGRHDQTAQQTSSTPYRFVIYKPDAARVEIAGSFTGWKKVPMERLSTSGYWEITLRLKPGEHSFTYILDGFRKIADPTIPAGEPDDFGGENSILYTGGNA